LGVQKNKNKNQITSLIHAKSTAMPFRFQEHAGQKMHIPNKLAVNKMNTTVEEGINQIYPLLLNTRNYRNL
jgi:hypothetical protein